MFKITVYSALRVVKFVFVQYQILPAGATVDLWTSRGPARWHSASLINDLIHKTNNPAVGHLQVPLSEAKVSRRGT